MTDTLDADLTLAKSAQATLIFPEVSTDQSLQTISLWYYDQNKIIWIEVGVAQRKTNI